MKIFSYLIVLLILILGVTFAILNAAPVAVHYYIGSQQLPLSLLLVMSFGIGLLIGLLVLGFNILRLKAKNRGLRKQLRVAEEEINNLRALPVKD